jgi:mannose-6-phosphate isomerase-like protein (cupin superfamily)
MTLPTTAIVRPPGAGDHHPGPASHTIKLDARHTDGQLSVEEFTCPPQFTGPPAHVHHAHDETFVILTGTLDFTVDGQAVSAPAGTLIYAPREVAHAFSNPHDKPATVLGIYTPAGYEDYFADLAQAMANGTLTPDTLEVILKRYHTDVVP